MHTRRRRGISLMELLMASSVMTIMAVALGTLAATVQTTTQLTHSRSLVMQHARVTLERIERACRQASANDAFPGMLVVSQTGGGWEFPDTLVVWQPNQPPASGQLPRFSELVIFTTDPTSPNRLWEVRLPGDARTVPAANDASAWQTELAGLRTASGADRVELTNLLNTSEVSGVLYGRARFAVQLRPSADELASFHAGDTAWDDLPWVLDIRGSNTGLRQAWCRIELQLAAGDDAAADVAVPFFGSAALRSEVHQ